MRRSIAAVLVTSATLAFVCLPLLHAFTHAAGVEHTHGDALQFMTREEFFEWARAHPSNTPPEPEPAHGEHTPEHLTVAVLALEPIVIFTAALPISAAPLPLSSLAIAPTPCVHATSARGPPARG